MLEERPDVAVVYGRRRERYRDQTVYNRLADLEWDMPIGEVKACGGDAMILMEAFRRVGGYDPSIIAAEDDELCLRIRGEGWKVLRIDAEMTLHDMAMTRFAQWWRRRHTLRACLRRRFGTLRPHPRAPLRPPDAQHDLLGASASPARLRLGLVDSGCEPRAAVRLSGPVLADRTLLSIASELARGGRSALRSVLRASQVSPCGRHRKILVAAHPRQAGPDHRIPRDRPATPVPQPGA